MSDAEYDPNANCWLYDLKKTLPSRTFKKLYGDWGPCDDQDRTTPDFLAQRNERRGDPDYEESLKRDKPKGRILLQRTGTDVVHCCDNHANPTRKTHVFMENVMNSLRPLNQDESPEMQRRISARGDIEKESILRRYNNSIKQKTKEKFNSRSLSIDPSEHDWSSDPIIGFDDIIPDIDVPDEVPTPKPLISPKKDIIPEQQEVAVTPSSVPEEDIVQKPKPRLWDK